MNLELKEHRRKNCPYYRISIISLIFISISTIILLFSLGIPFCGGDDDESKNALESESNQLATFDPNEDTDGDGVVDGRDVCSAIANPDQADSDSNGIGDACQDTDNDGIIDTADNCPNKVNKDQSNGDGDSFGDVCDDDKDEDGISDSEDPCPYNVDNTACNPEDKDEDGVLNTDDNCSDIQNTLQEDTDSDGTGNACDEDLDGDGKANEKDNCPYVSNPNQEDGDHDGSGDVCDTTPTGNAKNDSPSDPSTMKVNVQYQCPDMDCFNVYDDSGAFAGEITSDFRIALISGKTIDAADILNIYVLNDMITRTDISNRDNYKAEIITRTDDPGILTRDDLRLGINLSAWATAYTFSNLASSSVQMTFEVSGSSSSGNCGPSGTCSSDTNPKPGQTTSPLPLPCMQQYVEKGKVQDPRWKDLFKNGVPRVPPERGCVVTQMTEGTFETYKYFPAKIIKQNQGSQTYMCDITLDTKLPQSRVISTAIVMRSGKYDILDRQVMTADYSLFSRIKDSKEEYHLNKTSYNYMMYKKNSELQAFKDTEFRHINDQNNDGIVDLYNKKLLQMVNQCISR